MSTFDLLIRGAAGPGDVGVRDGVIAAVGPDLEGRAGEERRTCTSATASRRSSGGRRARVVRTLLRGRTVFAGGRLVGEPRGRLVTPA